MKIIILFVPILLVSLSGFASTKVPQVFVKSWYSVDPEVADSMFNTILTVKKDGQVLQALDGKMVVIGQLIGEAKFLPDHEAYVMELQLNHQNLQEASCDIYSGKKVYLQANRWSTQLFRIIKNEKTGEEKALMYFEILPRGIQIVFDSPDFENGLCE